MHPYVCASNSIQIFTCLYTFLLVAQPRLDADSLASQRLMHVYDFDNADTVALPQFAWLCSTEASTKIFQHRHNSSGRCRNNLHDWQGIVKDYLDRLVCQHTVCLTFITWPSISIQILVQFKTRFETRWCPDLIDAKSALWLHGMFRPRLKTRLGCAKCRARHKKCDERRPVCSACQKWDFPCIWPNSSCQTKPTAVFPIDSEKSEAFVTDDRDGMFWEGYQEDGSNDTRIWWV